MLKYLVTTCSGVISLHGHWRVHHMSVHIQQDFCALIRNDEESRCVKLSTEGDVDHVFGLDPS